MWVANLPSKLQLLLLSVAFLPTRSQALTAELLLELLDLQAQGPLPLDRGGVLLLGAAVGQGLLRPCELRLGGSQLLI